MFIEPKEIERKKSRSYLLAATLGNTEIGLKLA